MSILDPAETRRLTSTLALLASPVDGEVLAAAGAAKRILAKRGLGFTDLAVRQMLPPPSSHRSDEPVRQHQQQARRCLSSPHASWKPHESKFLQQMAEQLRKPTQPQQDWLDGLCDVIARKARKAPDVDF